MSGSQEDTGMLAAEYALGVLDTAEMREAEALVQRDAAFADQVYFWQDRLSPLAALIDPVMPPPVLWSRLALATGIGGGSRQPSRTRVGLWQGATAAALALAAAFAAVAYLPNPPMQPAQSARFAAALAPLASPARFLAEAQPDGRIVVTGLADASAPQGRDYQLWELPHGATTPVSLGVLKPGQNVIVPPDRAMAQTQLLVSDEPTGGSTTNLPTGPVVFGGTLTPLNPASTPGR